MEAKHYFIARKINRWLHFKIVIYRIIKSRLFNTNIAMKLKTQKNMSCTDYVRYAFPPNCEVRDKVAVYSINKVLTTCFDLYLQT